MHRGAGTGLHAVGVEPSGEAFNELSLDRNACRPKNSMTNAGAFPVHSLLVGEDASPADRVERARSFFSRLARRELRIDESVCASELGTAHRNLALAHMLRSCGVLTGDVPAVVEGCFRQCSILVTVRDLSVRASTLATCGVQPVAGEQAIDLESARLVMAVMAAAGHWLVRVGIRPGAASHSATRGACCPRRISGTGPSRKWWGEGASAQRGARRHAAALSVAACRWTPHSAGELQSPTPHRPLTARELRCRSARPACQAP